MRSIRRLCHSGLAGAGLKPAPTIVRPPKTPVTENATSAPTAAKPPTLAYAGMGVGILALGFSALFVRWAAAPGPVTGFYRMAIASLLGNTAPLWVAVAGALFLKEKLSGRFWIGLALVLSGAAAVLGADFLRGFHIGLGDLMAITAGVFYACYYLATQAGRRHLAS